MIASPLGEAKALAEELIRIGWPIVGYATVPESADSSVGQKELVTGPSDTVLWEPAPWLGEVAEGLPTGGDALDLACGSGRNTVYLAWRGGLTAWGVDILPDALEQARRLRAVARRVSSARASADAPNGRSTSPGRIDARFHQADLASPAGLARWLPEGRWNLVVVVRYLDRDILPRIAGSLRPGGHLVYQTFLEEQRRRKGSPRSDRHLLRPGELRDTFRSLDILRYEEGEDEEGNVLASLWARRP